MGRDEVNENNKDEKRKEESCKQRELTKRWQIRVYLSFQGVTY